jgi:thioredoxin-like negative regulator of GroEL
MADLLHFVASWSGPCAPHRHEVAEAAAQLGLEVVEVDIDNDPDTAQQFGVHNVPAVALRSEPGNLVVGPEPSAELVARFQPFL